MKVSMETINKEINSSQPPAEDKVSKEQKTLAVKLLRKLTKRIKKESLNTVDSLSSMSFYENLKLNKKISELLECDLQVIKAVQELSSEFKKTLAEEKEKETKILSEEIKNIHNRLENFEAVFEDVVGELRESIMEKILKLDKSPALLLRKSDLQFVRGKFAVVFKGFFGKGFYYKTDANEWVKII